MTFDTIVIAVGPRDADRVDRLADAVVPVATATGATVVLTHVFTSEQFQETRDMLEYDEDQEVAVEDVLDRHVTIREFGGRLDEAGVDWETRGVVDDVVEGVLDVAEEVDADRVVVAGRQRSPAGKAVFGSTAQRVLLEAPCPVTYVRARNR